MAGILKVDQVQSDSNLAFAIAGSNVAFMNATSLQMVGSNVSLAGTNVITNGRVVTAGLPVGTIVQSVFATNGTQYSTTASGAVTQGFSQTITPTSASNKIFVLWNVAGGCNGGNNVGSAWSLRRNGSEIVLYNYVYYNSQSSAGQFLHMCPINYLDNPGTTSTVTYTLYFGSSGSCTSTLNAYESSQLMLMEIAS